METNQINEIVEKHAADNNNNNQGNSGDNNSNNNNQGAGGGAGGGQTQEEIDKAKAEEEATARAAETEKIKTDAIAAFLKEVGADSVDALKEKLKVTGEGALTPEQKEKAKELYEANLQSFAVEKDLMKLEEFDQLKTLKSKQDADLVWEKYLNDWKEENPDVTEDVEKLAKAEFEKDYKLNSTNEKVKQRGIDRLAKEAGEIRNPLESSYNNAKEEYDADVELRSNFPKFVQGVEKIAGELVPENIEWFRGKDGEEEVPVEIPLPEADRKEILDKVVKRLQTPDSYQLFRAGKLDELKERVTDYADYLITKKTKEIGNGRIAEIFLGRGMEKGSKTGATNSFAVNQTKPGATEQDTLSKTEKETKVLEQFGDKSKK